MEEQEFVVRWEINVSAANAREAALQALEIQRDAASQALVFDVRRPGRLSGLQVDLAEGESARIQLGTASVSVCAMGRYADGRVQYRWWVTDRSVLVDGGEKLLSSQGAEVDAQEQLTWVLGQIREFAWNREGRQRAMFKYTLWPWYRKLMTELEVALADRGAL